VARAIAFRSLSSTCFKNHVSLLPATTVEGIAVASHRTPEDKGSIIGIVVGMLIAAFIAIAFASEAGTIVRYLIMSAGLVVGWLIGRQVGRSRMR
jgi:uncharacterized protein YcfJ